MTTSLDTRIPVAGVIVGAVAAQFADDAVGWVLPLPFLGVIGAVTAVLLTAVAGRLLTRRRSGPAAARTGLAVGLLSAAIGVIVGGFGILAIVLGGVTVAAGVAGAVARRDERPALPPAA